MTDFARIKAGTRERYARGYQSIGTQLVIVAERLCEAADLRAGAAVLDVATGTGNAALAAARRNCRATGLDLVPELLAVGAERARAEGLAVAFQEGDAEALPFDDRSFDFVLSTFGVQFTPDHERAASELLRVCKPGGRIALSSWTSAGFSGAYSEALARVTASTGAPSPFRWGEADALRGFFGDGVAITPRVFRYRCREPDEWLRMFREGFGPMAATFELLSEIDAAQLTRDINAAAHEFNEADDGTLVLPLDYIDAVVTAS